MSDGIIGGIAENLKEVVKETGKQAGSAVKDIPKVVLEQTTGKEFDDKQTEASLMRVRSQLASIPRSIPEENKGPEIVSRRSVQEGLQARNRKKPIFKDLASLQAATKAETGRGNKG